MGTTHDARGMTPLRSGTGFSLSCRIQNIPTLRLRADFRLSSLMQGFYEHGMNEDLLEDITEKVSSALCRWVHTAFYVSQLCLSSDLVSTSPSGTLSRFFPQVTWDALVLEAVRTLSRWMNGSGSSFIMPCPKTSEAV